MRCLTCVWRAPPCSPAQPISACERRVFGRPRDPVELEIDAERPADVQQLLLAGGEAVHVAEAAQHVGPAVLAVRGQVRVQLERQPAELDLQARAGPPGPPAGVPGPRSTRDISCRNTPRSSLSGVLFCRRRATSVRDFDCGGPADGRGKMPKDNGAPYLVTATKGDVRRAATGRSGREVRSIGLQNKFVLASLLVTLSLVTAMGGLLWYHVVQDRVVLSRVAVEESQDLMQREVSLRAGTVATRRRRPRRAGARAARPHRPRPPPAAAARRPDADGPERGRHRGPRAVHVASQRPRRLAPDRRRGRAGARDARIDPGHAHAAHARRGARRAARARLRAASTAPASARA